MFLIEIKQSIYLIKIIGSVMEKGQHWMIKRHRIFIHRVYVESPIGIKSISVNVGRETQITANASY